jgi:hypothetical protein
VNASRGTSIAINTISYTFYAGIVKSLSAQSMLVVLLTTAFTNIIGVWIAGIIIDKTTKDKLWEIRVTIPKEQAENLLQTCKNYDLSYNYIDIEKYYIFNFYCATQKESTIVKDIISLYNAKYFVSESKTL